MGTGIESGVWRKNRVRGELDLWQGENKMYEGAQEPPKVWGGKLFCRGLAGGGGKVGEREMFGRLLDGGGSGKAGKFAPRVHIVGVKKTRKRMKNKARPGGPERALEFWGSAGRGPNDWGLGQAAVYQKNI